MAAVAQHAVEQGQADGDRGAVQDALQHAAAGQSRASLGLRIMVRFLLLHGRTARARLRLARIATGSKALLSAIVRNRSGSRYPSAANCSPSQSSIGLSEDWVGPR